MPKQTCNPQEKEDQDWERWLYPVLASHLHPCIYLSIHPSSGSCLPHSLLLPLPRSPCTLKHPDGHSLGMG